ncbi:MaoC/PaaZ C-terminal domain-containing protein [Pseudonocardia sp. GCM10023141]|uniref:MaoC/PaaZ C-terminal domain-containing protein n=1 Tax=Pseudonocardia sp. GCM10023141 TaxID=3252653 RepID=UPI0036069940
MSSVNGQPIAVGDTRETVVVADLTRTRIVQYAGASGDYNPLHTDEPFATQVAGYPGVFAHGMLTMGLAGRAVTDWVGGEERLLDYGVRFTAQVWPGDTLTTTVTVAGVTDGTAAFTLVTVNAEGATVLTGTATAKLD